MIKSAYGIDIFQSIVDIYQYYSDICRRILANEQQGFITT